MTPFQAEKGKNFSPKCKISEKDQKSSTKIVPFQKRVKNPRQKMVPFQSEKGQNSSTKNVPFQKKRKGSKFFSKNSIISEEGQTSSTKMAENRQRKWYHFSQKRVKIPQQKWYNFRKWSKILLHMVKGPPLESREPRNQVLSKILLKIILKFSF